MERTLVKLQKPTDTNMPWLPLDDKASYIIQCHPISNSKAFGLYKLSFTGAFNLANIGLVEQLDLMVGELWTLDIEAKNKDKPSVPLACLCIGYLHMLFLVQLVDKSKTPYNQHNLSALFARMILTRLDALIISIMKSARDGRRDIDAESRPGLCLLYLYLSDLCNMLQHSDDCTIFVSFFFDPHPIFLRSLQIQNDQELCDNVRQGCDSLGSELEERLKTDCKNKVRWNAAFNITKTELLRCLRSEKPRGLYIEIVTGQSATNSGDQQSQDSGTGYSLSISGNGPIESGVRGNELLRAGSFSQPALPNDLCHHPTADSTYQDCLGLKSNNSTKLESGTCGGLGAQVFTAFECHGSPHVSPLYRESTYVSDRTITALEMHSNNSYNLSHKPTTSDYMDVQSSQSIAPSLICESSLGNSGGMSESHSWPSVGSQGNFAPYGDPSKFTPHKSNSTSYVSPASQSQEGVEAISYNADGKTAYSSTQDLNDNDNTSYDFTEDLLAEFTNIAQDRLQQDGTCDPEYVQLGPL